MKLIARHALPDKQTRTALPCLPHPIISRERKKVHCERGLFAGGISRFSKISTFSIISRKWSDSPYSSRLLEASRISKLSEISRISRKCTLLKGPSFKRPPFPQNALMQSQLSRSYLHPFQLSNSACCLDLNYSRRTTLSSLGLCHTECRGKARDMCSIGNFRDFSMFMSTPCEQTSGSGSTPKQVSLHNCLTFALHRTAEGSSDEVNVSHKLNEGTNHFWEALKTTQTWVGRPLKSTQIIWGTKIIGLLSVLSGPFPPTLFSSFPTLFPLQALFTLPPLLPSSPPLLLPLL